MICLLPLFSNTTKDLDLMFAKFQKDPVCLHTALQISASYGFSIMAVTNRPQIHALLSAQGVPCKCRTQMPATDNDQIGLPPGTKAAIQLLLANQHITKRQQVMVVDYRFVLLNNATVLSAIDIFRQARRCPVLSVSPVRDHPTQLYQYFRILRTDVVPMIDELCLSSLLKKSNARNIHSMFTNAAVSHPFFFDWDYLVPQQQDSGNRFFTMRSTGGVIRFTPLTAKRQNEDAENNGMLLYRESDDLARILFSNPWHDNRRTAGLCARPAFDSSPEPWLVMMADRKTESPGIFLREDAVQASAIRVWPFSDGRLDAHGAHTVSLIGASSLPEPAFRINEFNYFGPISAMCDCREIDGIAVGLVCESDDGIADFGEVMPGCSLSAETGFFGSDYEIAFESRTITRRQDFPELYSPNGAIALLLAEAAMTFAEDIGQLRAKGFVLSSFESTRVDSEHDLLIARALAVQKGNSS